MTEGERKSGSSKDSEVLQPLFKAYGHVRSGVTPFSPSLASALRSPINMAPCAAQSRLCLAPGALQHQETVSCLLVRLGPWPWGRDLHYSLEPSFHEVDLDKLVALVRCFLEDELGVMGFLRVEP
jgi:hypothetical protein